MITLKHLPSSFFKLTLFCLVLLAVAACTKEKETPNGFKFKVVKSGDGILPKTDDVLVFNFLLKDSKDSVWSDTFKEGLPGAIMIADSLQIPNENGMVQMFRMLSKGDSVQLSMPVKKFFNDIVGMPSVPPGVDTALTVSYTIRVKDFMSLTDYQDYIKNFQNSLDAKKIDEYLKANNITAQKDSSGLQYIIHNTTGNPKPTADNCVEVKYAGKFLADGKLFDKNEKIAFQLNQVIEGWKLGIPLLGRGDSATLFVPSALAYGPRGYPGAIPPNAILIFDVTLLNFGATLDQKTMTCK